jgi:cytochrome-b5 reductase
MAKVPVKVMVCGRAEMTAAIAGPKTKDYKQGEVGGILKEFGYTTDQIWKF